jgi:hypothetical protein
MGVSGSVGSRRASTDRPMAVTGASVAAGAGVGPMAVSAD